jgi:hypothetical protein
MENRRDYLKSGVKIENHVEQTPKNKIDAYSVSTESGDDIKEIVGMSLDQDTVQAHVDYTP